MYRVIGFQRKHLAFKDGNEIDGYDLYVCSERKGITGYAAERIFVSDARLASSNYTPALDDLLSIYYNRYGKIDFLARAGA